MKKVLSLMLTFLIAFGICTINASAEDLPVEVQLKRAIEETGVTVTDDTEIQLVSSIPSAATKAKSNPITALKVTNTVGSNVYTDFIIPGQTDSLGFDLSAVSSAYENSVVNFLQDSLFNIRITAVYNHYDNTTGAPLNMFYKPYAAYFTYQKKSSSVNVSHISVYYYCSGALYTYPGFEHIQGGYTHTIAIEKSNPTPSVEYAEINPLNNKVIYTGASGLGAGHDLSVYVTANGKEYGEYFLL